MSQCPALPKNACFHKAEKLGIPHAQLPIGEYMALCDRKVLTCNQIFEILLKYGEMDHSWEEAFNAVIPMRKRAKAEDGGPKRDTEETGMTIK